MCQSVYGSVALAPAGLALGNQISNLQSQRRHTDTQASKQAKKHLQTQAITAEVNVVVLLLGLEGNDLEMTPIYLWS